MPGHRLDAELLSGAAPGVAAEQVVEARRRPHDVEVAFVEDDASRQAGVGVHADAEQQAAGLRFLHIDENVLVFAVGVGVEHRDRRPHSGFRLGFEDVELGKVSFREAQVGIRERLPGIERDLAKDDVLPGHLVADDDDLTDASGRPLLHFVVDDDLARAIGAGSRRLAG